MQPTLDEVKDFFEENGWEISIKYAHGQVELSADLFVEMGTKNAAEFLKADFSYREQDLVHAPVILDNNGNNLILNDIRDYKKIWGNKVNYHGSPRAVTLYEGKFGASSVASTQVHAENGKTVAAVEAVFKAEGYTVQLSVSDKGTKIETWQLTCFKPSPYEMLTVGCGYSSDWAHQIGEANSRAAEANNTTVKYEGNFFYYGTPNSEWLFDCIGTDGSLNKAKLAAKPQAAAADAKPQAVTAIENVFKANGFETVMATPSNKGTDRETWQITCVRVAPYDMLIIGYGSSEDWAKTEGGIYSAAATAYNTTVKYKGSAFFYGTPGAEKIYEGISF